MNDIQSVRKASTTDLWSALEAAAPEVAAAAREAGAPKSFKYNDYEGFREWLLVEFALNVPITLIRSKLEAIQNEQANEGLDRMWPTMSKYQLQVARRDLAPEWQPIRHSVEERIADVGIVNKVQRLSALQQMAEELSERMWDERNEKTGQLYLLKDYRETLRAVAEEMGDLGKPADDEREGLVEIAKELIGIIKVQGSGLQDTASVNMEFDYETGEYVREDE